jgi:hypothetical protein
MKEAFAEVATVAATIAVGVFVGVVCAFAFVRLVF